MEPYRIVVVLFCHKLSPVARRKNIRKFSPPSCNFQFEAHRSSEQTNRTELIVRALFKVYFLCDDDARAVVFFFCFVRRPPRCVTLASILICDCLETPRACILSAKFFLFHFTAFLYERNLPLLCVYHQIYVQYILYTKKNSSSSSINIRKFPL